MAQQTVTLIDLGIYRSDPTIVRTLDPAQDVSTKECHRFLVGSLGPLNAVAPNLAKQIDETRAVIAEPPAASSRRHADRHRCDVLLSGDLLPSA
jgi:hypothetical protein